MRASAQTDRAIARALEPVKLGLVSPLSEEGRGIASLLAGAEVLTPQQVLRVKAAIVSLPAEELSTVFSLQSALGVANKVPLFKVDLLLDIAERCLPFSHLHREISDFCGSIIDDRSDEELFGRATSYLRARQVRGRIALLEREFARAVTDLGAALSMRQNNGTKDVVGGLTNLEVATLFMRSVNRENDRENALPAFLELGELSQQSREATTPLKDRIPALAELAKAAFQHDFLRSDAVRTLLVYRDAILEVKPDAALSETRLFLGHAAQFVNLCREAQSWPDQTIKKVIGNIGDLMKVELQSRHQDAVRRFDRNALGEDLSEAILKSYA